MLKIGEAWTPAYGSNQVVFGFCKHLRSGSILRIAVHRKFQCKSVNKNLNITRVFQGVLGTRFGSIEFQILSLESEKIIIRSLEYEKIEP